jgi:H/ACA ribonucleoprotein complex subunit 2
LQPYVYTPSRKQLGAAMGVKRGSLMVLIREHEDYQKLFNKCKEEMEALPIAKL